MVDMFNIPLLVKLFGLVGIVDLRVYSYSRRINSCKINKSRVIIM
ncbi:protein of unknown function [Moritella yayanosii]|uniref:Uncharacterized protein n=1 Tax=Moritella yayanosii TaxID=69539 RepID=A0A330LKV6_9GAMM|nr:protein of unknown function [Moritella yayanosii]